MKSAIYHFLTKLVNAVNLGNYCASDLHYCATFSYLLYILYSLDLLYSLYLLYLLYLFYILYLLYLYYLLYILFIIYMYYLSYLNYIFICRNFHIYRAVFFSSCILTFWLLIYYSIKNCPYKTINMCLSDWISFIVNSLLLPVSKS